VTKYSDREFSFKLVGIASCQEERLLYTTRHSGGRGAILGLSLSGDSPQMLLCDVHTCPTTKGSIELLNLPNAGGRKAHINKL
jgi:hypothetical protein